MRVHAAALTRDELEWPVNRLPAIPSYELSGVVVGLGPGVDAVSVGDEVFGITAFDRDGVAADYAAIPAELLAPKPRALSHVEAAAVPLAALSAWQGLFDHGRLVAGERVLIHGATGGDRLARSPRVLRDGGRLVSVAGEPPQVTGVSSVYFVGEANRRQLAEIARLLDERLPRPAIDSVFALEDARSAFERSLATGKRGKVVLEMAREPRRPDRSPA